MAIEVERELKVNIAAQAAGKLKIDITFAHKFMLNIINMFKGSIYLCVRTYLVQDL